jgi:hypothetical protein
MIYYIIYILYYICIYVYMYIYRRGGAADRQRALRPHKQHCGLTGRQAPSDRQRRQERQNLVTKQYTHIP